MAHAIAIDMGGTKIKGVLIDEKYRITDEVLLLTEAAKGRTKVISNITRAILAIKNKTDKKIKGVGISMPGFVDSSGKVVFAGAALRSLVGTNLKQAIMKNTGLNVYLENDANCFALAEAVHGAGKGHNVVLGIIWGSGVGGGIVMNKKVFSGAFGGAGEFGHIVLEPGIKTGPKCGCGQRACLEMLSSGVNISRMYIKKGGKIKNANPKDIYLSKEKIAKEVIGDAIHYLGLGISILVNTINPDIIVVGGGVSQLPEPVYAKLRKEVKKYAVPILTKDLKIVRFKVSNDAGAIGAAALVFEG